MKRPFLFLTVLFLIVSCEKEYNPTEKQLEIFLEAKQEYENGHFTNSIELLNFFSSGKRKKFHQARLLLAKDHFFSDNYDEAEFILRKLLQDFPQYTDAQYWLVQTLLQKDQIEEAEKLLLKIISFNSEDPRFSYLLGQVYELQKDYNNSIDSYNTAALSSSDLVKTYLALSRIYYRFGQYSKAEELLEKCLILLNYDDVLSQPIKNLLNKIREEKREE